MSKLFVIVIFGLIAYCQGESDQSHKSCLDDCFASENDCRKKANNEDDHYTCSYELGGVCLKKCDGRDVTETRDEFVCIDKCFGNCGKIADASKRDECALKEYNCVRTCRGLSKKTAEQYKVAFDKCDTKLQKCLEEHPAGVDCADQFIKCMNEQ